MKASRDLAAMNRIVAYVRNKFEASMAEIDIELGIPVWKQYVLARSFREYFPDIVISRSRWRNRVLAEPTVVPASSQNTLSADFERVCERDESSRLSKTAKGSTI